MFGVTPVYSFGVLIRNIYVQPITAIERLNLAGDDRVMRSCWVGSAQQISLLTTYSENNRIAINSFMISGVYFRKRGLVMTK